MTLRRVGLLVALYTLLAAVYLFSYSGRIESGDTLALFDTTSSLIYFGDNLFDQSASAHPPPPGADARLYPLLGAEVEPLHSLLAGALVWLADRWPGVGLVHAAWLLNSFISAAAVGTLLVYALALGYSTQTATLAALLLGLATALWPYSKTFFREPLALWLILLAALLLDRWRAARYRSLPLLLGSGLALASAYLAKEAVVFALPALALIAAPELPLPPERARRLARWSLIVLLLALVAFVVITLLSHVINLMWLYQMLAPVLGYPPWQVRLAHYALHGYLLSIGGSVWGTSPVVLLALPGMWLLYRRGQYRYSGAAAAMTLAFALGYAVLRGVHWFGGLSWPPRFLLPVLPFLLLAALPALDRLTRRPVRTWMIAGAGILIAYSLWIQLSGVTLPWGAYTAALPPEAGGLSEWGGGLNLIRYLRWVVIPPLWATTPLDFAWVRVNAPLWPLLLIALAVYSGWQVVALLRGVPVRGLRLRLVLLPLALAVTVYTGLRLIYADPLYLLPEHEALAQAVAHVEGESVRGDVLLLSDDTFEPYFLNYGRLRVPRVISLPDQPGDQPSPEQPAAVVSDNPDALLTKETIPLLFNLASQRDRLWLLEDAGPWLAWSTRPVERFLAAHYYPVQVIEFAPTVRLIEYNTTDAPNPYAFRGPDRLAGLVFGDQMRLAGFSLPRGDRYAPGEVLPVSLYWQAEQPPERDYTVALFLASADGTRVVQGMDTPPGGGFERTSQWRPGVPVWDNRALRLPADLPPGDYRLWVKVYAWEAGAIDLVPVTDGDRADDSTGVLPATIEIQSYG
ncbi:MAG: hypothetical protein HZC41_20465 [Chloroflexi bacterium]|nr:hypothetical protein [Chloroflexota bacterium]